MRRATHDSTGALIERGDDATRAVYGPTGSKVRDYTQAENQTADDAIAAAALAANEAALRNGLQAAIDAALARQAEYQTVLDATNATINGSPASYIKTVARQGKRSERALIRLIRLVGGLTTTANTGTD